MELKDKTTHFLGKTTFVFSGIGSQWKTMGSELYQTETVFRQIIDDCDAIFSQYADWSIVEEITKEKSVSRMHQSIIVQPCIFAIQAALFGLIRTWGIKPDALIGHSGGELVATHCAGILSLKDAIHLVWQHNLIMQRVIGKGKMAHIALSVNDLETYLYDYRNKISIAAVNSPNATVLTGDEDVLKELIALFEKKNIFCRMLKIDIPFHSHFIEPYLEECIQSLESIENHPASIPVYSSCRGAMHQDNDYDAHYWAKHIREKVLFSQAVCAMINDGYRCFIEISPHPVLSASIHECFQAYNIKNYLIAETLKRDESEKSSLLESMAVLNHAGFDMHWDKMNDEDQKKFKALIKNLKNKEKPVVRTSLINVSSQERKHILEDLITKFIEDISCGQVIPKDKQTGFLAMGLTSLMAVHLIKALTSALQISMPVTILFNYPNVELLSNYLNSEIQNALFQNGTPINHHTTIRTQNQDIDNQIAVIGMSCRFPGGAKNPDLFWNLLSKNNNGRTEIPRSRWDLDQFASFNNTEETVTKWANFLSDESLLYFDAGFFKIPPKEAESMDPQQRLLLETAWQAFENAGISVNQLKDKKVGVYVGICTFDFQSSVFDIQNLNRMNQYSGSGAMYSCAAGRLSYFLNLHGPCLAIDTACSSSLVAIDLACQAIQNNKAEIALVAGVNLLLTPHLFVYFSKLGALSPDGICKTFDASADGYARGEGCGAVILKRLSHAISDKDNILAVIKGTAVNHDGASSSFTAPNGLAQQQVIRDALNNANILPHEISYVEAHGTGTALGDPIEVNALGEVYSKGRNKDNPLIIGSVKANIGHLEGAAGMASLIKTILCLNHEYIPKQIHFNEPNPYISWNELPIKIPTEKIHWPAANTRRLAGISSFGFSGTNTHIIIEEAPRSSANSPEAEREDHILTLSAHTEKALYNLTERYEKFLETTKENIENICYTANTGRTYFNYCFRVQGKSKKEIKEKLSDHLKNKSIVISTPQERHSQGHDVPSQHKVVLPNYPFQRKRYEIKTISTEIKPGLSDHPLIGKKVVSPALKDTLIFDALFTGNQPDFLNEHIIFDQKISPAAAHIAMVLSAVNTHFHSNQCSIEDADFINPLIVNENQDQNVQLIFENSNHNEKPFKIVSSENPDHEWTVHCEGKVITDQILSASDEYVELSPEIIKQRCQRHINGIEFHKKFASAGYQLGKHFQCIEQAWCGDNEAVCALKVTPDTDEFKIGNIHPGLIDSIFQSAMLTSIERLDTIVTNQKILIPLNLLHFNLFSSHFTHTIHTYAKSRHRKDFLESDIIGWNQHGTLLFEIKRFALKETDKTTLYKRNNNLDHLFYSVEWEEKQAAEIKESDHEFSAYLIFSDNSGTGKKLADNLKHKNIDCIQVFKGNSFQQKNIHEYIVNPLSSDDFTHLFDTIAQNKFFNILFLWGSDAELPENTTTHSIEEDLEHSCGSLLHLTQSIIHYNWNDIPKLWIITRHACERSHSINAAQRSLWGMGRVIALEHPELWGGLFDLEDTISEACINALFKKTTTQSKDDQISLDNNGICYVPRLKHHKMNATKVETIIKSDATYLITGGLGALGLLSADWLVRSGCKHLVLIGRNIQKPDANKQIFALKKQGIQVLEEQIDISDKAALASLFNKIQNEMPPIKGIIHTAGILDDGILIQQNWQRFKKVMHAKVTGSWNLHQFSQNMPLDFFVMYSSAASLTGNKGQINYAAANAFMDGLAYYRRSKGFPATSINWGPWDAGMAAVDKEVKHKIFNQGFQLIQPEMGLEALNQALLNNMVQIGIMNCDLNAFVTRFSIEQDGLFSRFVHSKEQVKTKNQNEFLRQLENALPEQRISILTTLLKDLASEVAGYEISVDQPLMEQDFDSLMAVELRNGLNKTVNSSLPVSIFFDYPSLEMVAEYLIHDILQIEASSRPDQEKVETIEAAADFLEEIEGLI
jgi:acyl transferase domain-containing protein/short-subunit dehydrogenase/acyl carrier protein